MIVTLEYQTEHLHKTSLPYDSLCAVSTALSDVFRGSGITAPWNNGTDYESVRVALEGDHTLVVRFRRTVVEKIEYDNVAQRGESIALLISRSQIDAGIPGVIPESIRFTVKED